MTFTLRRYDLLESLMFSKVAYHSIPEPPLTSASSPTLSRHLDMN
jgi:hypothetical protein